MVAEIKGAPRVAASVARRAAVHAALGEPARLRIVDELCRSDATPGDLRRLLGMPSNLVAHHLGVLEAEGLVRRRRSEGDRRRSYVRLVPDALAHLLPEPPAQASRIVFVCTANTARSQLAAALWNQASDVPATSAGTHPADTVAAGAVDVARRHQVPLRQVAPRSVADVLTLKDSVVTVCDSAHEELLRRSASDRPEVRHWSVVDPVAVGTPAAFDAAFDDLAARVAHLSARVTAS